MSTIVLQRGPELTRPNGDPVWERVREVKDALGKVISYKSGRWAFALPLLPGQLATDVKSAVCLLRGRDKKAEEARQAMIGAPKYYRLSKAAVKRMKRDKWPTPTARRLFIKQRKQERKNGNA